MAIMPSVDRPLVNSAPEPQERPSYRSPSFWRWVGRILSTAFAVSLFLGTVALGLTLKWKMPRFSALAGWQTTQPDDWCQEHAVPESVCVECQQARAGTKLPTFGWCKKHGVHECPLCHPEVAQLDSVPSAVAGLVAHFEEAESVAERGGNNSKCKLHLRRLQFASAEAAKLAGVRVEPVGMNAVFEAVTAPSEVVFDPTAVARASARLPGVARRLEKGEGDIVRQGDLLALIEAPEAGKARAELAQAQAKVDAERKTVTGLMAISGTIPERRVREAEASLAEARIRLAVAEQTLANLGLAAADVQGNLLPVVAPQGGVIVRRQVSLGEAVEPGKPLFVIADPARLWLMLRVKQEDVARLRIGLEVQFASGADRGAGPIAWIGSVIDENTRTVPVRAELPAGSRLRAGQFGTGRVVLRQIDQSVRVPSESVHWEGCCNVVFVRDRRYEQPGAAKVFHVRKVVPGVSETSGTEILAGLLPGEVIATGGSGLLRAELLRNNLGAG